MGLDLSHQLLHLPQPFRRVFRRGRCLGNFCMTTPCAGWLPRGDSLNRRRDRAWRQRRQLGEPVKVTLGRSMLRQCQQALGRPDGPRPTSYRRRLRRAGRRTGRRDRPHAPRLVLRRAGGFHRHARDECEHRAEAPGTRVRNLSPGDRRSEPETKINRIGRRTVTSFGLTIIVPTRSPRRRTERGCLARLPDRASSKLLSSSRSP